MAVRVLARSPSGDPKIVPVGERVGVRVRFLPLATT
jgi:hypothetical protein